MKTIVMILSLCSLLLMTVQGNSSDKKLIEDSSHTDEVRIAYSGISMPLGRFMLIRKNKEISALKFTKFWNEIKGEEIERNAAYISYYQNDGNANFLGKNVKITEEKASSLPMRSFTRLFLWQPGTTYVKCGPLKFNWEYYGFVCACEKNRGPGEYGFEFAPTPWESINDVNVFDKRIKWYRFDKNRKPIHIPVDKLWEHESKE